MGAAGPFGLAREENGAEAFIALRAGCEAVGVAAAGAGAGGAGAGGSRRCAVQA